MIYNKLTSFNPNVPKNILEKNIIYDFRWIYLSNENHKETIKKIYTSILIK